MAVHQNPTAVRLPVPHRISKCLTRVKFEWAAASASDMQIGKSIISACILPAQKWWSVLVRPPPPPTCEIKETAESAAACLNKLLRAPVCIFPVCATRMCAPWWMMRRPSIRHQSWPRDHVKRSRPTVARPGCRRPTPIFACWSPPPLKSGERTQRCWLGQLHSERDNVLRRGRFLRSLSFAATDRQNASKLLPRHCAHWTLLMVCNYEVDTCVLPV